VRRLSCAQRAFGIKVAICIWLKSCFIFLYEKLDDKDAAILHENTDLLHEKEARMQLMQRYVLTEFPTNVVSIADDANDQRIDRLIKRMNEAGLEESI
jgi:hypothetical protein